MPAPAVSSLIDASPYQGYSYAYPHKSAYRPFAEPFDLRTLWADEQRSALSLYLHIPFCEMRCGFCNLFTQAGAAETRIAAYVDRLCAHLAAAADWLGPAEFARGAIGGGTPTVLTAEQLERIFAQSSRRLGVNWPATPTSVETSPATAVPEKLAVLRAWGVTRVSLGVESFEEVETTAVYRPQQRAEVEHALDAIRSAEIPVLNVDLIYGLPGQTPASWARSLDAALAWRPEELYLYPLYVRPLTGLGRSHRQWDDDRLALYRRGRDRLLSAGYEQLSMRMFRAPHAPPDAGPAYCCQTDGMVGLGCGARSYTAGVHYASEYAVGAHGVRAIIDRFLAEPVERRPATRFGFQLDPEERRRRFVLQSLLLVAGLDRRRYHAIFETEAHDDFPLLAELADVGWAQITEEHVRLTPAGLERSDAVGPALYSSAVRSLMEQAPLA